MSPSQVLCRGTISLFITTAFLLPAETIPAGTELQVRLMNEVSSQKSSGQEVTGQLIAPVLVNNQVILPDGTRVSGKTADAVPWKVSGGAGQSEQIAKVRIDWQKLTTPSGKSANIAATTAGVDNARESVNTGDGTITGITGSQTFTSLLDQGISKVAGKYEGMGQMLGEMKNSMVKEADAAVTYKPGVEMTVKLSKPLDWNGSPVANPVGAIEPADQLATIVTGEQFRTSTLQTPKPSDVTNLMFIGTQEQLQAAFKDSGWFSSDPLGRESKMKTAQAIIQNTGYDEAPMSVLTLDGKPPEFTFQKQLNTFASRHHIRIWKTAQTFDGKPVWVGAGTHDIKIYFSKTSKSFTHGIDPNIDHERAKVSNDFVAAGYVQGLALVDRPNIPAAISNATGDQLQTDKKMAVLLLKNKS